MIINEVNQFIKARLSLIKSATVGFQAEIETISCRLQVNVQALRELNPLRLQTHRMKDEGRASKQDEGQA